jgi:uncharacterized protein (TIGR02145 family)
MKTKVMKSIQTAIILVFLAGSMFAQNVGINDDGSNPNGSAMLDVKSTTKGMLIPRMTSDQLMAIANPVNGLQVFCTTDNKIYIYISTENQWKEVAYGSGSLSLPATYSIGTGESCSNTIIEGSYIVGVIFNTSNYVTIGISVSKVGSYSIATELINGYSFSKSGTFNTIGTQTLDLIGNGTPVLAQIDQFTAIASNDGGACTFNITIQNEIPNCGIVIDPRDGNTYNTVQIGNQCWMSQNLNIGMKIPGNVNQINNSIIEKYCISDLESNCDEYGGLYQWDEAMQYSTSPGVQGICPTGWHLPTNEEWITLSTFLGGGLYSGGKLKEAGYAHWAPPNTGATNSSGFTALPGGYRTILGNLGGLCSHATFWSSSQGSVQTAWGQYLYNTQGNVHWDYYEKTRGFSVRCIHD